MQFDSRYMVAAISNGLFSSARVCPDDGVYDQFLTIGRAVRHMYTSTADVDDKVAAFSHCRRRPKKEWMLTTLERGE